MTARRLHISSTLSLPLEFVTSTQAILAIRGAGKTYTASVLAEEILKSQVPVIVIDPTGSWWGLKSAADGKSAAYPVVVFGGEHADVPLEESAGEMIAKAIVEHRFSAILDLKLLRKGQWYRLLAPFLETLYHLNREPVHLFVDEAHRIAPQKLPKGAVEPARVLGAMEDIAQMGRSRGLGCTVISQRPAVVNKNVLTQCPALCCMRVVHNIDLAAVRAWIEEQADISKADEMIRSLPSLPTGEAWFWWPEQDVQKHIHIRQRETFDSSRTPKVGEKVRPPKVMAAVDIQKLGEQIKATVEKAKAEDPRELKREITELKRQLAAAPSKQKVIEKPIENRVEIQVPFVPKGVIRAIDKLRKDIGDLQVVADVLVESVRDAMAKKEPYVVPSDPVAKAVHQYYERAVVDAVCGPSPILSAMNGSSNGSGHLPPGERATMIAVAQFNGVNKDQLSVLTGYKRSSRDAYIARLSAKGYVQVSGRQVLPTQDGIDKLGKDYEPLPVGRDLQDYWLSRLPEGERRVLEFMLSHGDKPVSRDAIDEATGYKRSSRDAYLSRMASRRVIEVAGAGEVRVSPTLFD